MAGHGRPFIDITGQTFGRLTVLRYDGATNCRAFFLCRCECGATLRVEGKKLRSGHTKSCGCLQRATVRLRNETHGKCRAPEYSVWQNMKRRCSDPSVNNYRRYGGRGIGVCPEWESDFDRFLADMGPRPSASHQIERVDNDGPYAPSNCIWATRSQQSRNRSTNVVLTWNGETHPLSVWAERLGVKSRLLAERLRHGWPVERVLFDKLPSSSAQ